MARQTSGHTRINCVADPRLYALLTKRAKKQGVSVNRYIADYLTSFFGSQGIGNIRSKKQ